MPLIALQITMMELSSRRPHHRISHSIIDMEASQSQSKEFFKHYVTPSDSTFSLALKYGITVEQLKRENKLWSNDALFLREYLLVPLTKENSQCIPENSEIVRATSLKSENDSVRTLTTSPDSSCPSCDGEKATSTSAPDLSAKDFLNKYDSNIAQLKSNVQKMEESTSQSAKNSGQEPCFSQILNSPYQLPGYQEADC